MGKQIIFLLSVCLEMSCLSFFSPFPPHFLLNYPKFEVICPLPFSINHRWWEFDALLISGEPTFSLQDIFGRFFFLMSSDMKFQDNMSGFFNFLFPGYSGLNTEGFCHSSSLQNDLLLYSILFLLFFLRYWTCVCLIFVFFPS